MKYVRLKKKAQIETIYSKDIEEIQTNLLNDLKLDYKKNLNMKYKYQMLLKEEIWTRRLMKEDGLQEGKRLLQHMNTSRKTKINDVRTEDQNETNDKLAIRRNRNVEDQTRIIRSHNDRASNLVETTQNVYLKAKTIKSQKTKLLEKDKEAPQILQD